MLKTLAASILEKQRPVHLIDSTSSRHFRAQGYNGRAAHCRPITCLSSEEDTIPFHSCKPYLVICFVLVPNGQKIVRDWTSYNSVRLWFAALRYTRNYNPPPALRPYVFIAPSKQCLVLDQRKEALQPNLVFCYSHQEVFGSIGN